MLHPLNLLKSVGDVEEINIMQMIAISSHGNVLIAPNKVTAKKCRSEKKKDIPVVKTSFLGIPSSNVGYSDEDLHTIFTCRGDARATLQETVSVNGVPLAMEIDTGAVVSVVGNAFYETYLPQVPLSSFSKQLHSYSGEVLATKGEIWLMLILKVKRLSYPWLFLIIGVYILAPVYSHSNPHLVLDNLSKLSCLGIPTRQHNKT